MDVLFESLVSPLSLAIGLGVIPRIKVQLHVEELTQRAEKRRDELFTPIAGDMRGNSVFGKDMDKEKHGKIG